MFGNDEENNTLYRDLCFVIAMIFLSMVIVLLLFVNPPKQNETQEIKAVGSLMVETIWDNENPIDVDTWVRGPDGVKVGYSNKSGPLFNLLRDDTGHANDVSGMNYENIFSRGIIPGWYTVNLHLFAQHTGTLPATVRVVLSMKSHPSAGMVQFYAVDIPMMKPREEVTVLRFRIDGNTVDRSSFSTFFEPIAILTMDDTR
jgi:hypothetical protein